MHGSLNRLVGRGDFVDQPGHADLTDGETGFEFRDNLFHGAREGPVEAGAAAARGAAGLYAETGRAADDRANRIPSREINVKSEVMEAAVVGIFMKVR